MVRGLPDGGAGSARSDNVQWHSITLPRRHALGGTLWSSPSATYQHARGRRLLQGGAATTCARHFSTWNWSVGRRGATGRRAVRTLWLPLRASLRLACVPGPGPLGLLTESRRPAAPARQRARGRAGPPDPAQRQPTGGQRQAGPTANGTPGTSTGHSAGRDVRGHARAWHCVQKACQARTARTARTGQRTDDYGRKRGMRRKADR